MSMATNAVAIGTVARTAAAGMNARELAEVKRRITQLVDVDERGAIDEEAAQLAAAAADTFNAEASDSRLLLAAAEHELRMFGVVCTAVAGALREWAEMREARRLDLVSRHAPLLF